MYSYRWLSRQTKRANVLLDPSRNEKEALCSEGTFLLVAEQSVVSSSVVALCVV